MNSSTRWQMAIAFVIFLLLNYGILYFNQVLPKFSFSSAKERRILASAVKADDKGGGGGEEHVSAFDNKENSESVEEKKPRNDEWEQLNKYDFFRRTMAYYFIDRSLLRVYFLTKEMWHRANKTKTRYAVQLLVSIGGKRYPPLYFVKKVNKLQHDGRGPYELASLNLKFDLAAEIQRTFGIEANATTLALDPTVRVRLIVVDTLRNITTFSPIQVKLKSHKARVKKGAMVCTYCYFYGKSDVLDNYYMFMYWIELNKLFGYRKVALCNHSFPDTQQYAELFAKHAQFVHVYQLKTFPNFVKRQERQTQHAHNYFHSFNEVNWQLTVPLEVLSYNECYMDNLDTYKYISINGADELIIPRNVRKIATERDTIELIADLDLANVNDKRSLNALLDIESQCASPQDDKENNDNDNDNSEDTSRPAPIERYLGRLDSGAKGHGNLNFHFGMGHYLRDFSVNLILDAFDSYFNSTAYAPQDDEHEIKVIDPSYQNFTFRFILNGKRQVSYVRNLAKIYRLLVGDFKRARHRTLATHLNQFSRFVYVSGKLTQHLCGKSIYNTRSVLGVNVHYPDKYEKKSELTFFNYNSRGVGLDSHFRHNYNLGKQKYDRVAFDELKIDLNYLYCYYRHILKTFLDLDIIADDTTT